MLIEKIDEHAVVVINPAKKLLGVISDNKVEKVAIPKIGMI